MTIDDVLTAASGLIDGEMSEAEFRATLRDDGIAVEHDAAGAAKRFIDSVGDEPASASDIDAEPDEDSPATIDNAQTMPVTDPAPSFDRPAEDAPSLRAGYAKEALLSEPSAR